MPSSTAAPMTRAIRRGSRLPCDGEALAAGLVDGTGDGEGSGLGGTSAGIGDGDSVGEGTEVGAGM